MIGVVMSVNLMTSKYLIDMQMALSEFDGRSWYDILHREEDQKAFAKMAFDCSDGWSCYMPKAVKKLKQLDQDVGTKGQNVRR
jgi:hypothetical protein